MASNLHDKDWSGPAISGETLFSGDIESSKHKEGNDSHEAERFSENESSAGEHVSRGLVGGVLDSILFRAFEELPLVL